MGSIGLPELVIIFLILMLIFGANRLSGLGKGLGQAIRGFKDADRQRARTRTPGTTAGHCPATPRVSVDGPNLAGSLLPNAVGR